MDQQTIRIGIIGAGRNTTEKHIPGFQAIDGVEIVGVCNRSRESSERVAQHFGIAEVYENWWEVIEDPITDAILIGTWPYLHRDATLAALIAGKHVLCEARMAMDAHQAHAMLGAANANPHLVTQIVPSPFTLRVDNTVRRLIAEGYLGDLLAISVRDYSGFLDADAPLHWRQDFDLSGYNIMSLGIWYEAILRWVGEATEVMAMGQTFIKMRKDPQTNTMKPVHIPEHLDVTARMGCGAQLLLSISHVAGLVNVREIHLFGSEGTLSFSDNKLYGGRRGDSDLQEIPIPADEAGSWRVEEEFINAIRGKEQIKLTRFEDGVKYMEFTEAVSRSMAERRMIILPL